MIFLQGDQVRNVIKELKDKYEDKESAVLIEAAQNIRDKQVSRAIDILKACPFIIFKMKMLHLQT